jgi:hypothetical protein
MTTDPRPLSAEYEAQLRREAWPSDTSIGRLLATLTAERARHAALVAAARLSLDLLPDLSVAFHQTGSIRDHADPKDRTGWNVHGIETCDDSYCLDAIAAIAALRAALPNGEPR